MADDLSLMDRGRILQSGEPREVYGRPASLFAARLLGDAASIPAVVRAGRAETAFGAIPTTLPDGPAMAMLRPEALRPTPGGADVRVESSRFAGHSSVVRLSAGGVSVTARMHPAEAPEAGQQISVRLDERFCSVFPA